MELLSSEPVCILDETFKVTKTTTWIWKHLPLSVSISSNIVNETNSFGNSDPHNLVASFIGFNEKLVLYLIQQIN